MVKPFRFGVVGGAPDAATWTSLAQRAEELGYAIFMNSDHLDMSGAHFSTFAPVPALAVAGAATNRIRLGTIVINQDLHHPAVLAREVASLDVLSDGRFELGLGAGWAEYEYDWAGITFDPAGRRITRLAEYVAVLKALLENAEANFEGEFFTITAMPGIPRPTQSPRPPLMLGGTGKRMLSLAAREGDIVSVMHTHPTAATSDAMDERIEWIREAAGSRFDEIELQTLLGTVVVGDGDRKTMLRKTLAAQRANDAELSMGMSEEELMESPIALVGTPEAVAERLQLWRERWGFSYVTICYPEMESFAPVVELLSGK